MFLPWAFLVFQARAASSFIGNGLCVPVIIYTYPSCSSLILRSISRDHLPLHKLLNIRCAFPRVGTVVWKDLGALQHTVLAEVHSKCRSLFNASLQYTRDLLPPPPVPPLRVDDTANRGMTPGLPSARAREDVYLLYLCSCSAHFLVCFSDALISRLRRGGGTSGKMPMG